MDDIAMNSEFNNEDRAKWAQAAIDAYQRVARTSEPYETLGDLLTDLHHWADLNGVDFEKALCSHGRHYNAERRPGVIQGEAIREPKLLAGTVLEESD